MLVKDALALGAMPDYKTKNKTALRMAAVYKALGIKNYYMQLLLIDHDLVGVDPHDPDLSVEMIDKVVREAKVNIWYVFREILRIPKAAGSGSLPFRFDRANISMVFAAVHSIPSFTVAIRQTGKTTTLFAIIVSLGGIMLQGSEIIFVTHNTTQRDKSMLSIKAIYEELPPYFQLRSRKAGDKLTTIETFTINAIGNKVRSFIGNLSEKIAKKMGRGLTSPVQVYDEVPFISNIDVSLEVAGASGIAARDQAKKDGMLYTTIMATTAGYLDVKEGRYAKEMYDSGCIFNEKLFDSKDSAELEVTIRSNSPRGVLRLSASWNHRLLGKSDQWLRNAAESSGIMDLTSPSALADLFNIWSSGSALSAISPEDLVKINNSKISPVETEITDKDKYMVLYYVSRDTLDRRMKYAVLGSDTSDAIGSDSIGIVIRCYVTGERLITFNVNSTNLSKFSIYLYNEYFKKYKNLVGIIERKSSGGGILDFLVYQMIEAGEDPFRRLFNTKVNELTTNEISAWKRRTKDEIEEDSERYKKSFGYSTSGSGTYSRTALYGVMYENIQLTGNTIRDGRLIEEYSGLRIKNGRIDHDSKGHDDMVISDLLGFYLLNVGNNLSLYGIKESLIFSKLVTDRTTVESEPEAVDRFKQDRLKEEQSKIRQEIESLQTDLGEIYGKDRVKELMIEARLHALESKIVYSDEEDRRTYSLEAFKANLTKEGDNKISNSILDIIQKGRGLFR